VQIDAKSFALLIKAAEKLDHGFARLPPFQSEFTAEAPISEVLEALAERLADNFPYFHPLYAGQMLKPPHPVARLAYALAMFLNPNNHALDGGRATSEMEKEAVAEIAGMFGWDEHLGHLAGGGTMANLEALWVAGQLTPGKTILASEQAHYTHSRISAVLKLPFQSVASDERGRMDIRALEARLKQGDVGTVVATLGTTATGSVDQLADIVELQGRHGFRLHVDAAYGGYYVLLEELGEETRRAFSAIVRADSMVIDPHKHGLQPYGCGCVLFKDPAVGRLYKHNSPYTYFSSAEMHLGEISLECSRAGAAAAALWATQKLLPLRRGGDFARALSQNRRAALKLFERLQELGGFIPAFAPELDIVVYAVRAPSAEASSELAHRVFEQARELDLHLALAELPARFWRTADPKLAWGQGTVTSLRSVLMKPEHLAWVEEISERLQQALRKAGG
jgi:tyrosine decarboxylase / aspartate 1-decarboxylase